MSIITIERKVLEKNDEIAGENRKKFKEKKIFTLNFVSSPGSGKTSLIEKTLEIIKDDIRTSVIEGDVQTDLDAKRVEKYGVPVVQIVTNGACHLEAALIRDAFIKIEKLDMQLLFIENVGNLVCPAGYDLGEDMKVVILSVTEGDDKPLKYPAMFRKAPVLIINKIDLIPYINCSLEALEKNALKINSALKIFKTSCTSMEGIQEWSSWIKSKIK